MHRILRVRILLPLPLVLCHLLAQAQPVERYMAELGVLRLEISAPRADIVRVRAGRKALPEDASWAVATEVRRRSAPMEVTETGDTVELRTAVLAVRLDRKTLDICVSDLQGRVIVDDARGRGLRLDEAGFRLRKKMAPDAHYFGLGDKTGPLDRRGESFALWNTDAFKFGESTDPLYKSIPFVLAVDEQGSSFGVFLDNTWRSVFDFGKAERDTLVFGAEDGPLDYYVMAGPDPKTVVRQYAYLTGTAPLTPRWALGFQQSHWSYATQGEVSAIASRLRADRLPADVIYMDIDYQDRNRPFTVDTTAFPDLPGLVQTLKEQNLRLILITDLHIAHAPGQAYAPYDSGKAADLFLKNPDGSDYVGIVWPGDAVFPDFSRAAARDWWGRQYEAFVRLGVAGFWNDMNEPAIFKVRTKTMPLDTVHRIEEPGFAPRTASHAEMHNVYGMLNSRATYEGLLRAAPDTRPFVLTRASAAGGQRYAATWTGDNASSWAHLRLSIGQLVNLGLSGFAYAGDDIGGFAGDQPSADLLTRWIQIGAFNPIFRDHYQKKKPAQEPWVNGDAHEDIRRHYLEERYRLLPYLYGLAEENSRTGLPIMRPVFLEFPQVLRPSELPGSDTQDQFMLGARLLIAPANTMESPAPYVVRLPGPGPWYDYWTGRQIDEASLTITPRIDVLPVFVRGGTILARQPLTQSTAETPQGNLELGLYPGPDCQAEIYLDDGISFAYRRGDTLRQSVTCSATPERTTLAFGVRQGSFRPWWPAITLVVHGWTANRAHALLDGKALATRIDADARTLTIVMPDVPQAATLSIAAH